MILIDLNQIVIVRIYSFSQPKQTDMSKLHGNTLFPKALTRDIFDFIKSIHEEYGHIYGDVVMCADGDGPSWRKSLFPHYKAGRKKNNDEQARIMKKFVHDFVHEFWMNYRNGPCYVYKINGVEADDIIARLVLTNPDEKHLIVSKDKDFFQLHTEHVSSLDYSKKRIIREDGEKYLQEHIIRGDSGDGIPNIISDIDTFVNENKRQSPMTKKRMAKFLKEIPQDVQERYEQNRVLISLKDLPDFVCGGIDKVINQ